MLQPIDLSAAFDPVSRVPFDVVIDECLSEFPGLLCEEMPWPELLFFAGFSSPLSDLSMDSFCLSEFSTCSY
jgi:hypothetical protein